MTDNEIVKALECFAIDKDFDEQHCIGCVFEHQFCSANMSYDIAKLTLDLINRQKAEVERLQKGVKVDLENYASEYDGKIKVEAYREFAERVKICLQGDIRYDNKILFECDIDNILKELVGEDG